MEVQTERSDTHFSVPDEPADAKRYTGYIDYLLNRGKPGYPEGYRVGSSGYVPKEEPPVPHAAAPAPVRPRTNRTPLPGHPGYERELSLEYDGDYLTFRIDEGREIKRFRYPAVSGRKLKDGTFDYSPERQKIPKEGPIPEGNYWIDPHEIYYNHHQKDLMDLINMAGANPIKKYGRFPGGSPAWGSGKIPVKPEKIGVDGVERSGFTIHGGAEPGSAGCIDLTDMDKKFFEVIERYRGIADSIPLKVDYSRKMRNDR